MKKMDKKIISALSLWLMALLFFASTPAMAQYTATFSDPAEQYAPGDEVEVTIENLADLAGISPGNVVVFFYLNAGPAIVDPLNEGFAPYILDEFIIPDPIADPPNPLKGTINEEGDFTLYVGVYVDGLLDHITQVSNDDVLAFTGTTGDPIGGFYNQLGHRYMFTIAYDINNLDNAMLYVNLTNMHGNSSYPIVVEYSVNAGASWTILEDVGENTEFIFNGNYTFDLTADANEDALTTATHFRARQVNSAQLSAGSNTWRIGSVTLEKGESVDLIAGLESASTFEFMEEEPPIPDMPVLVLSEIQDEDEVQIFSGYSGDEITIIANAADFPEDYEDYNYAIGLGNVNTVNGNYYPAANYLWLAENIVPVVDNDELTFTLTVPVDLYSWTSGDIRIWVYDGDEIEYGEDGGAAHQIIDVMAFTEADTREFVSEAYEIPAGKLNGVYFTFDLRRLSTPLATFGSRIIVSYSTDEGVTWEELETISLNQVGTAGASFLYTYNGGNLPAEVATAATHFKIEQENPFPAGVHTWEVSDMELFIPGDVEQNILVLSNGYFFNILSPQITVSVEDIDVLPNLYPGDQVTINVDNPNGEFPEGTIFEMILYRDFGDYILLGAAENLEDPVTITIPFVETETLYRFRIRAELRDDAVLSNYSEPFAVYRAGDLAIESLTTTFEEFNYPGNDIELEYSFNGNIGENLDLAVQLQVWVVDANGPNFWHPIADPVAFNPDGDVLLATLPVLDPESGLSYGGSIRVRMDYADEVDYFNYTLARFSSIESVNRWITPGARFGFNLFAEATVEQDVSIVYSFDQTEWHELATKTLTPGFKGYLFSYVNDMYEVPVEQAQTVYFTVEAEDVGNEGWFRGNRTEHVLPVNRTAQTALNMLYPSITLGEMEDEYYFADVIDVSYSIDMAAEFPEGTHFAVVLQQGGYFGPFYTLAITDEQDFEVTLEELQLPTMEELEVYGLNPENDLFVRIYAFTSEEELVLSEELININNFYNIRGSSDGYSGGTILFNQQDLRWAVTQGMDLTELPEPMYLRFYYETIENISAPNPLTIPRLEMTLDNGQSYELVMHLPVMSMGNEQFTIELEMEAGVDYSNARFRWYQEVPDGQWAISNMRIIGETNEVDFYYSYINGQWISLIEFDDEFPCEDYLGAEDFYHWEVVHEVEDPDGFEQPVYAGEDFEFTWEFVAPVDEETGEEMEVPQYPVGTEFYFYVKKKASAYKTNKALLDVAIEAVNPNVEPGSVHTITFELSARSPDTEWIIDVDMAFPSGITILGASSIGPTGQLSPSISGQAINWSGSWIAPGTAGQTWSFTVDIETSEYISGALPISWFVQGDEWGSPPHTASGTTHLYGPVSFVLINKDGLPITMDMEEMLAHIPTTVNTGVYEVFAQAVYPGMEDEENVCEWDMFMVKDNLLVVNEGDVPDELVGLTIDATFDEDEEATTSFVLNDDIIVEYTTFGVMPEGVQFATVLMQGDNYAILNEDLDEQGAGIMVDATLPLIPLNPAVNGVYNTLHQLMMVAYVGDDLIVPTPDITLSLDNYNNSILEPEDDFLLIQGLDDSNVFSLAGDRLALTRALDLSEFDEGEVQLVFNYTANSIIPNPLTLPKLQVSVDGGNTFQTMEVDGSAFGEWGLLDANVDNKQYRVTIPEEFLTAATHFKWSQQVNFDAGMHTWSISNISVQVDDSNIILMSNLYNVNIRVPSALAPDYSLTVVADENGFEPVMYPGGSYQFNYELMEDGDAFPEGTVFYFQLHGSAAPFPYMGTFAMITEPGEFTLNIPATLERGNYIIAVFALTADFSYQYRGQLGITISIFNPVLKTVHDDLDILYAGGEASFTAVLESIEDPDATINTSYWYNLILTDGDGVDWLIAAQQGSVDFDNVVLPPFYYGMDTDIRIQASIGSAIGEVGKPLPDPAGLYYLNAGPLTLANAAQPGERVVWEIDMAEDHPNVDLTQFNWLDFEVYFSEQPQNLTDNQKMVVEYSIDGGSTFTTMRTYPDARFNDPDYFDQFGYFLEDELAIPAAAKTDHTIFRFRIEETKGTVELFDVLLWPGAGVQRAPYHAVGTQIDIAKQRIMIAGTDEVVYCNDSEIEISYSIKGGFGENAVITLWADGNMTDVTYTGITHGTGTVTAHASHLDAYGKIRLQFSVEDNTFTPDILPEPIVVIGDLGDMIEVVAPIDEHTDVMARNAFSCETTERFLVVGNPQPYFQYQVRNAQTHDMLGDAVVYTPGMALGADGLEIPIGIIDSKTRAEVVVTAMSSDGSLMCETLVLDEIVVFDIRDYVLQYRILAAIGQSWRTYTGEEDFLLCENSDELELRLWNNSTQSSLTMGDDVKWYRNNMETPLSGYILDYFPLTGSYFAVVRDAGCEDFVSVEVFVTVEEAPVKPEITFVGNYDLCEGETAMLMVSDEYAFYRWYKYYDYNDKVTVQPIPGNNQNTLVIYESATYWVEVSNHEFDPHLPVCSEFSEPLVVNLNIHEKPYIGSYHVYADDLVLCESGIARIVLPFTEEGVMYQLFNINTGELSGAAQVGGQNNLILTSDELTENTHLGIIATRIGNQVCEGTRVDVNGAVKVNVYNLTILVSGNTLMASISPDKAMSYQWYRNGVMVMNNGQSRTLNIYDDAEYSVVVETYDGCILHESTAGKDGEVDDIVDAAVNTFSIYPNPVQNQLTLQFNGLEGDVQVRIIGLGGEIVREVKYTLTESQVEETLFVEELNQGIYMIQIVGSEHTEVKRFIKK